jgi:hypothetical protein
MNQDTSALHIMTRTFFITTAALKMAFFGHGIDFESPSLFCIDVLNSHTESLHLLMF